jgi:hypothetical protein
MGNPGNVFPLRPSLKPFEGIIYNAGIDLAFIVVFQGFRQIVLFCHVAGQLEPGLGKLLVVCHVIFNDYFRIA